MNRELVTTPLMHWQETRSIAMHLQILLASCTGILIALPFIDPNYYWASWIAYTPLLLAVEKRSISAIYGLGLLSGLACYMMGAYYIVDFLMIFKGYSPTKAFLWSIIFWLYSAQLPAVLIVLYKVLNQYTRVHPFILFPVVCVSTYSAFPMLFSAQMGESQSLFLTAIQPTEFFGVYGLDAVMALVNIILVHAILKKRQPVATIAGFMVIGIWFSYGVFALQKWQGETAGWDSIKIGLVQPNETPTLGKLDVYGGYSRSYPPEFDMTERLASAGAELVVWPEARYKAYFDQANVKAAYQSNLAQVDSALIFQDMEQIRSPIDNSVISRFNGAAIIDSEGTQVGHYRKRKRVAFGEYIPLINDVPIVRSWVDSFFGDFLTEISKGETDTQFSVQGINIVPLICYEAMFPEFVAHAFDQKAAGSLIVAMSSNGWFGHTRQPYQHIHAAVLRAVENRTPMLHAVNNGPSTAVLPTGDIIFMSEPYQAGGYLIDLPFSQHQGGSFFSRHPDLFIGASYLMLLLIIALACLNRVRAGRKN